MELAKKQPNTSENPPIYVVSCGEGINGEQLVRSALVQFPDNNIQVIKFAHVHKADQAKNIVAKASENGATIAHTLVDPQIRGLLVETAEQNNVTAIDLMSPMLDRLTEVLKREPISKPGLYREFNQVDLDRAAAIEFSIDHDDGLNPDNLDKAEIILVGVSRSGKTPLSMYLAVLGWKVANVPLVEGIPLPEILSKVNKKRIFALSIDPEHLLAHRQMRQRRLGTEHFSNYSAKAGVFQEVEYARTIYRKNGFTCISVSNKPIESSAEEIVEIITQRFKTGGHKRSAKHPQLR